MENVKKLVFSLFFTSVLVIITIPLWNYSSANNGKEYANSYRDLSISLEVGELDSLITIEDDKALTTISPTQISMRNQNGFEKTFELVLLVDKQSTIPYELLRVSIDNKIYKIEDLKVEEDEDNYYFTLEKYSIDRYSDKEVTARLWLKNNNEKIDITSFLTTNFITR